MGAGEPWLPAAGGPVAGAAVELPEAGALADRWHRRAGCAGERVPGVFTSAEAEVGDSAKCRAGCRSLLRRWSC